jgi:ketosteroid isomerase-like protein
MRPWASLILAGAVLVAPQRTLASDALLREFEEIERVRSQALKVADLIENVRARGVQDTTLAAHELEVRLVGEIALVVGRIVGTDTAGAVVREGRFLHVYRKGKQGWTLVAAQATPLQRSGDGPGSHAGARSTAPSDDRRGT